MSFIIPRSDYDLMILGSIYLIYHIAFEASSWHATPGKKWTKIKVSSDSDRKVTTYQAIVRNLTKILSLLLFFAGFILIAFNTKRKALHDYIGGTLVLFDED